LIHSVLLGALLLSSSPSSPTERLWLVVAASDPKPAGIAQKGKSLSGVLKGAAKGLAFQTSDCGDKKNVFGWAVGTSRSAENAQEQLAELRATVKDAYVKRCDVRPQTLLSLRFPVVDPSIADIPDSAVNWEDEDRISTALPLPGGRTLVVARYFANIVNDPLEGRRERVVLVEGSDRMKVLEEDCPSAGGVVVQGQSLAFACAREQAGEQLLHSVLIFGVDGKKVAEVPRCRKPHWVGPQRVSCGAESVGADGRLQVRAKLVDLGTTK
jgi:hypothetical protein